MSEWQMEDLGALLDIPPAATDSAGYVWTGDPNGSSNHIVYMAEDSTIHELYKVKGWSEWGHNNLSESARAPRAQLRRLFGYTWDRDPDGPSQNVLYIGDGETIHQLYYRPGMSRWAHTGLHDEVIPAPALATANTVPFAYVWDRDPGGSSSQHIIFAGSDSRIHEFYTRGGGWSHHDLHTSAGALHLIGNGTVTGYVWDGDPAGSSQHVIWQCNLDSRVHEFWFNVNDRRWHDNDLTRAASAPRGLVGTRAAGTIPFGYSWERDPGGSSQHVIYKADDHHLHELWFGANGRRWSDGDRTQAAGTPDPHNSPCAFTWDTDPGGPSENIVYRVRGEIHVQSFGQDRSWRDVNLTKTLQLSPAPEWSESLGWAWNDNNSAHVTEGLRHYWAT